MRHKRLRSAPQNVFCLTKASSGLDNLNWCDNLHRWYWQLWEPGADLDWLQKVDGIVTIMYTLSREGHGGKGE